jgi:hypothetical protein
MPSGAWQLSSDVDLLVGLMTRMNAASTGEQYSREVIGWYASPIHMSVRRIGLGSDISVVELASGSTIKTDGALRGAHNMVCVAGLYAMPAQNACPPSKKINAVVSVVLYTGLMMRMALQGVRVEGAVVNTRAALDGCS